ncbi:hypothetical protein SRB5_15440 [Streptomyces sp. RB5]|uniref:Uncharacterized protein n=1 Tax=Streptomyces smaragdinus TaxID=2585196 RepID=A0A7K0CDH4_9ACTN|nr:hypothetical protein [Streptomyces smaragdinus]MQY11426.1 hypothetical protein [Streptomyces smaragdinus]
MNDIHAMRNINHNLFLGIPATANALEEYDPEAAAFVREAAQNLVRARRDDDPQAMEAASAATFHAAAELLKQAGRSVSIRFPIMVAARMVELEAALIIAKAERHSPAQEPRSQK